MSFRNAKEWWLFYKVNRKCMSVTRCKCITLDNIEQVRRCTIDRWQVFTFNTQLWQCGQQSPGVWMPCIIEDFIYHTIFNDLTSVHNGYTVCNVCNNAQVVGDVDNGHVQLVLQVMNQVKDLSLEQIAKIYTGEITNWKDVGGEDAEIVRIGREAGSGTRDGFESITDTKDACQYRQELTSTGDVITTVSQNPNAIGYASLAAIKDSVKALTVNGVAPTEATVKDGTYLVQRPFVLVTKEGVALSETAQKFFNFATSADAASIISAAGAVPVA